MTFNEVRIVVYKYSVGCCTPISLQTQGLSCKKFVLNGTKFGTYLILCLFLHPRLDLSIQGNECGLRNYLQGAALPNLKPLTSDTKLSYTTVI